MPTLSESLAASASALAAERTRIETAISNLANAESTRGPGGGPYRRRAVVLSAEPVNTFEAALGRAGVVGVKVAGIVEDPTPFPTRYQPSHPDADANGFVAVPNVKPSEEVVDMMSAARAYQANLAAIGLVRDLVRQALDLAR